MSQYRIVTEALRLGFPTAKHLALAGGFSVQTAVRYRRGETCPDALTIARLMGRSRAVAEAMLRLAGLDDLSLDHEQARLVRALADLETKKAGRYADMAAREAVGGHALPLASDSPPEARRGPAATPARPADRSAAPRGGQVNGR
jgi:hypothetical protein